MKLVGTKIEAGEIDSYELIPGIPKGLKILSLSANVVVLSITT
jgi:hypothetical protein